MFLCIVRKYIPLIKRSQKCILIYFSFILFYSNLIQFNFRNLRFTDPQKRSWFTIVSERLATSLPFIINCEEYKIVVNVNPRVYCLQPLFHLKHYISFNFYFKHNYLFPFPSFRCLKFRTICLYGNFDVKKF